MAIRPSVPLLLALSALASLALAKDPILLVPGFAGSYIEAKLPSQTKFHSAWLDLGLNAVWGGHTSSFEKYLGNWLNDPSSVELRFPPDSEMAKETVNGDMEDILEQSSENSFLGCVARVEYGYWFDLQDWTGAPIAFFEDMIIELVNGRGYDPATELWGYPYNFLDDMDNLAEGMKDRILLMLGLDANMDLSQPASGPSEGKRVTIVAHSMGGIIARAMCHHYPGIQAYLQRMVVVGSPLGGGVGAVNALMGEPGLHTLHAGANGHWIIRNAQTLYQQVPFYTNSNWIPTFEVNGTAMTGVEIMDRAVALSASYGTFNMITVDGGREPRSAALNAAKWEKAKTLAPLYDQVAVQDWVEFSFVIGLGTTTPSLCVANDDGGDCDSKDVSNGEEWNGRIAIYEGEAERGDGTTTEHSALFWSSDPAYMPKSYQTRYCEDAQHQWIGTGRNEACMNWIINTATGRNPFIEGAITAGAVVTAAGATVYGTKSRRRSKSKKGAKKDEENESASASGAIDAESGDAIPAMMRGPPSKRPKGSGGDGSSVGSRRSKGSRASKNSKRPLRTEESSVGSRKSRGSDGGSLGSRGSQRAKSTASSSQVSKGRKTSKASKGGRKGRRSSRSRSRGKRRESGDRNSNSPSESVGLGGVAY